MFVSKHSVSISGNFTDILDYISLCANYEKASKVWKKEKKNLKSMRRMLRDSSDYVGSDLIYCRKAAAFHRRGLPHTKHM